MAYRFTDTDKWRDPWFRALPSNEKLLFNFLCDNCDLAGFYEVDIPMISFQTCLSEEEIKTAFKGLTRGFIGANGWIWIVNFLKNQKNLPLNPENNAHKHIINLIKSQLFRFPSVPEKLGANMGLLSPPGKGKVEVKVKIKKGEETKSDYPFEEFWNAYDKKVDKKVSEAKWVLLKEEEKKAIMLFLPEYIKSTPEKQFRKDPETFLNRRSWENEIIKPQTEITGKPVLKGSVIDKFNNRGEVF